MDASILTPGVIWFSLGVLLFLIELITPGLIFVFFGAGAWLTAIVLLNFDITLNQQLLLFSLSSTFSLAFLRQKIKNKYTDSSSSGNDDIENEITGRKALCIEEISPGKDGKVEYKGALWQATSKDIIQKKETVEIVNHNSIKLIVKKL